MTLKGKSAGKDFLQNKINRDAQNFLPLPHTSQSGEWCEDMACGQLQTSYNHEGKAQNPNALWQLRAPKMGLCCQYVYTLCVCVVCVSVMYPQVCINSKIKAEILCSQNDSIFEEGEKKEKLQQ